MKVHQQKTKFVHLAAMMFAGQTVGEFMERGDHHDDGPDHRYGRQAVEPGQVLFEFPPIERQHATRYQNHRCRKDDEMRRETETDLAHQPVEEPVRIADLEPQV